MGTAALLLWSMAGSPASVWPHPESCRVAVESGGTFSDRGQDEVNLVNAPFDPQRATPPALDVPPAVIAAWNAGLGAAADDALRDLHLAPVRSRVEVERLKKAAAPVTGTADRSFALRVEVSPENGLGGHAAGNAVRLTLTSMHRAPDIAGVGWATVAPAGEAAAVAALRAALVAGITQAFTDLQTHLADEVKRPRAHLRLVIALDGLSAAQRDYAVSALAPCAAGLAEPLSVTPSITTEEASADVEYRLRRHEEAETEDSFVAAYAGRLSFEIGPNGKDRCSTWQSPLEALEPHVGKDVAGRLVVVRFKPKQGG